MSKHKVGDVFTAKPAQISFVRFMKAKIIAFTPDGVAILEVVDGGQHCGMGELLRRDDRILEGFYDLVPPKPEFFEVGAFYRFTGGRYIRYEIKEVYATDQLNCAPPKLQAHAEASAGSVRYQVFLTEAAFKGMIKM